MGLNSKIEWTDDTFNPWWGCTEVSPACDNCYARGDAKRYGHDVWGKDADRRFLSDSHWKNPLKWDAQAGKAGIRRRVFCGSMCDIMERRDDLVEPRQRLFGLVEETSNLDWLLLTKRPQEYSKFLPKTWLTEPRPNVWLMTTVEHQDYVWRIDEILKVPAVVHGVSMEPLLGPITLPSSFLKLGRRAWAITGGESGRRPRPSQPDWFRSLRDQCVSAGVPFHFKQWGEYGSELVKIGKKAAGRILDGRQWDELPTPFKF
jgi:protein gp37